MIIDSLITVAAFLTLAISFSRALPHNNPPQDDPHQRFIPFDEFPEAVKGAISRSGTILLSKAATPSM